MADKLISVIIPAYNHEKYVQETIRSIMEQSYTPLELIIIDDGSTDSTYDRIAEMEEACRARFVRFERHTQPNQGTCVTINRLLSLAQGEYVALIASDDKYTPTALAELCRALDGREDAALAVGNNLIMDSESRPCYWDERRNIVYDKAAARWQNFTEYLQEKQRMSFDSPAFGSYEKLLLSNHVPNGYLIRRSIFEKTGSFTKEAPLEDYWLMLQIAKHARMIYVHADTFYYRWHAANTMKQTEKIRAYTAQTLRHEYASVQQSGDERALRAFAQATRKNILRLPCLLSLYKEKTPLARTLYLSLLGLRIPLSVKKSF